MSRRGQACLSSGPLSCDNRSMAPKKPKPPAEKVFAAGIKQDKAKFLYYVDRQCNVVRMERGIAKAKTEVIAVTGLKRDKGWDYFLDDDGDVAREPEA